VASALGLLREVRCVAPSAAEVLGAAVDHEDLAVAKGANGDTCLGISAGHPATGLRLGMVWGIHVRYECPTEDAKPRRRSRLAVGSGDNRRVVHLAELDK
jgi:hypothetical protein